MELSALSIIVICAGLLTLLLATIGDACDEATCASLVSKCMLIKACECDLSDKHNCPCCKKCQKCLSDLYTECCSCVGLCPKRKTTHQFHSSTVERLPEPLPALFDVLTEEKDEEERWTSYSYPAHLDLLFFSRGSDSEEFDFSQTVGMDEGHRVRHGKHHAVIDPGTEYHNCTVAFMSQCMSLDRCQGSCESMGAAGYRWFNQHGCCECIGDTCLDYGMGEAQCLRCPEDDDNGRKSLDKSHGRRKHRYSDHHHMQQDEEEDEDSEHYEDTDYMADEGLSFNGLLRGVDVDVPDEDLLSVLEDTDL